MRVLPGRNGDYAHKEHKEWQWLRIRWVQRCSVPARELACHDDVTSAKEAKMIGSFIAARRLPVIAGALAAVALALGSGTAQAATPIGPNQIFLGEVNGSSAPVNFDVVCPGVANIGHAFGDTVGVVKLQDPIPGFGRTGNATSIAADLIYTIGTVTVVEPITTFTTYTTTPVSSSVSAPCSGTGTMVFTPVNGGSGSTPAAVTVRFVNVGASS
jgi:hypothetical protein